jgi:hypothetical protein
MIPPPFCYLPPDAEHAVADALVEAIPCWVTYGLVLVPMYL